MSKQQDKLKAMIARAEGAVKTKPIIDCEDIDVMFPSENPGDQFYPDGPHYGQVEAWGATERIVVLLAGTQGGKTTEGARLFLREIQRTAVPGEPNDYLIVGPNTELLLKKAIPEFLNLTCNRSDPRYDLADYKTQRRIIVFTPEGSKKLIGQVCDITVFIGYATKPDSLEAASYKAIWPDECGMEDFKKQSWEALDRRSAIHGARIFLTTTPYVIKGWLKKICDHPDEETFVISFPSTANPKFPKKTLEKMKRNWSDARYKMFCLAEWAQPHGAVYDCFENTVGGKDGKTNVCEPFTIPKGWKRHVGTDFGKVNMAAVFIAEAPDRMLYVYGTYRSGGMTTQEHAKLISKKGLSMHKHKKEDEVVFEHSIGGTWTGEDPEFRRDFINAGFEVHRPPIKGLEVGISRVYRQFKTRKLKIFSDCKDLIAESVGYARKVNEYDETLTEISNKETYHLLDALRYLVVFLRPSADVETEESSRVDMDGVEPVGAIDTGESLRTIV